MSTLLDALTRVDDDDERFNNQQQRRRPRRRRNRQDDQFTTLPTASESLQNARKKKPHFVNLISKEGHDRTVVKLPGRHACDCEARRHKLVNNCLSCGRIVCEQEGSGACFFCGQLVCTKDERQLINSGTNRGRELKRKLMSAGGGESPSFAGASEKLRHAVEQKDKLIGFDKDSARRTKVIDDQSDYYAAENNPFLSKEDRDKLRERRQELLAKQEGVTRAKHKVTLDFMGRQVLQEETEQMSMDQDPIIQEIMERTFTNAAREPQVGDRRICEEFDQLKFDDSVAFPFPARVQQQGALSTHGLTGRIQGSEIMQMSDSGACLSMHQPYASMLVRGIKKHEGRNWFSPHRGRLWIASASKQVDSNEAIEIENFYRRYYDDKLPVEFPEQYQSSVLLGCVDVIDCLPQEEYREIYPNGESESAYVFICENPQEMPLKFPVVGKHKIFRLDQKIHNAAKKMLK